jgi:hypothetical protein
MSTESANSPTLTVNAEQLQQAVRDAVDAICIQESPQIQELYFIAALNCISDEIDHSSHQIPINQIIADRIEKLALGVQELSELVGGE